MKAALLSAIATILLSSCSAGQGNTEETSTVDTALQTQITSILEQKLEEYGAQSGQVVLMETQTGRIKALAGKDFARPYKTAARTALLLAALGSGNIQLDDTVDTGNGQLAIARDTILYDHNWRRGGYGKLTVRAGFAHGSRIAQYRTLLRAFGNNLPESLDRARTMGYGMPDSIGGIGKIPSPAFSSHGERVNASPLQSLAFVNAIANGGRMVAPCLSESDTAVLIAQIAGRELIDSMKSALRYTVTNGLGKAANTGKVPVAGVTGTNIQNDSTYRLEFCGYFPADKPQYSLIVTLHKTELPASGGLMCGSIFREIAEYLVERDSEKTR